MHLIIRLRIIVLVHMFFICIICKGQQDYNKSGKIVFLGNSITEFWSDSSDLFKINESFINKGISGHTTSQMLNRFEDDVINQKPNTVIILAGINDIAQNTGPISIQEITNNIIKMSELAITNKINVIICSVLPAKKFMWNPAIKPRHKVIFLNSLLKKYCRKNKISYLDYYSKMVDFEGGLQTPQYTSKYDLVHPNKNGYKVMEEILLNKLNTKGPN